MQVAGIVHLFLLLASLSSWPTHNRHIGKISPKDFECSIWTYSSIKKTLQGVATNTSELWQEVVIYYMHKHMLPLLALVLAACTMSTQGGAPPLPQPSSHETPLHFGLYVTPDPAQNPIDPPERFTGYHAATDFEIDPSEQDKEIPVYAICTGKIIFSGFSDGYGGLLTQFCTLAGQDVTVIYGHLAVDSLVNKDTHVKAGATIAKLGAARSRDTDGSRKHLHLGIAKGHTSEVRGYVQSPSELELFLDPQVILNL